MSSRHIRLSITPEPDPGADVNLAKMRLRERLMRFLFGPMRELTLIVPGHQVSGVTITRGQVDSSDLNDEELDALAASMARHPAGKRRGLKRGETK